MVSKAGASRCLFVAGEAAMVCFGAGSRITVTLPTLIPLIGRLSSVPYPPDGACALFRFDNLNMKLFQLIVKILTAKCVFTTSLSRSLNIL